MLEKSYKGTICSLRIKEKEKKRQKDKRRGIESYCFSGNEI